MGDSIKTKIVFQVFLITFLFRYVCIVLVLIIFYTCCFSSHLVLIIIMIFGINVLRIDREVSLIDASSEYDKNKDEIEMKTID